MDVVREVQGQVGVADVPPGGGNEPVTDKHIARVGYLGVVHLGVPLDLARRGDGVPGDVKVATGVHGDRALLLREGLHQGQVVHDLDAFSVKLHVVEPGGAVPGVEPDQVQMVPIVQPQRDLCGVAVRVGQLHGPELDGAVGRGLRVPQLLVLQGRPDEVEVAAAVHGDRGVHGRCQVLAQLLSLAHDDPVIVQHREEHAVPTEQAFPPGHHHPPLGGYGHRRVVADLGGLAKS